MQFKSVIVGVVLASSGVVFAANAARADTYLWISDSSNNIGELDLTTQSVVTGSVHNTGQLLTDIAFIGAQMYGASFAGLYSVNTTNGALTSIGSYGSVGNSGMNALLGSGANLLGASATTNEVYSINPTTAAATNFASSPLASAGDLAYAGNTLYEAGVGSSYELVNVTTDSIVGPFSNSAAVYGFAYSGGVMYAVAGTEVYSVNLSTAALTPLFSYAGSDSGLQSALGMAVVSENASAVPEPSTWALMLAGFAAMGFAGYRRRNSRAALSLA